VNTISLPLETPQLLLRTFASTDLEALSQYYALPEMQRYVELKARDRVECTEALRVLSKQITLQRPGDVLTLAIVRKYDKALLGHVSLHWYDATAAQGELRFMLNPIFRGHGYAQEAVRKIIDVAFENFSIHRIFTRCDARNNRAVKLMQRIGMRLEAHYREHALFKGEWDEELHFAVLDREWRRSDKVRELTHRVA
jgi:RimJ/RimL family protein N-acetyltransferase